MTAVSLNKMYLKQIFSLLLLLLVMQQQTAKVSSYKILAVYAFPGKSHYMMHTALIKELVRSGHQVTMITAFTLEKEQLGSNYTEILIEPVYDFWHDIRHFFNADNLFELTSMDLYGFLKMLEIIGLTTSEHALKQPKVQEIINAEKTEGVYDLLLSEQFYQEVFLALAYKYNIPIVTSSTLDYQNHMSQKLGLVTPWSFVPHGFTPLTDRMNFWQRLQNSYYSLYEDLNRLYNYFPKMDALVTKYFKHLPIDIPKVAVMEKQITTILINSHAPLTTARPTSHSIIPVAGMHIYPPKALPTDIAKFLDDAHHGAIYFSLGSNVQSKDMPDDMLRLFLEFFATLKQRVLWKFETENISNLPENVMLKKWLPQSDILAHKNVKVFITHGGLFGTQEGVHYAVPMLGIPFYCDQHLNMNKAVQGGYAISLHFQSITKEILNETLQQLLYNVTYRDNIQRVSNIFRDRPLSARESAVYWIEYIIRHKGAPHMRSAALDLNWYELYIIDVIAFVLVGIILILLILWRTLRYLLCRRSIALHKSKLE